MPGVRPFFPGDALEPAPRTERDAAAATPISENVLLAIPLVGTADVEAAAGREAVDLVDDEGYPSPIPIPAVRPLRSCIVLPGLVAIDDVEEGVRVLGFFCTLAVPELIIPFALATRLLPNGALPGPVAPFFAEELALAGTGLALGIPLVFETTLALFAGLVSLSLLAAPLLDTVLFIPA